VRYHLDYFTIKRHALLSNRSAVGATIKSSVLFRIKEAHENFNASIPKISTDMLTERCSLFLTKLPYSKFSLVFDDVIVLYSLQSIASDDFFTLSMSTYFMDDMMFHKSMKHNIECKDIVYINKITGRLSHKVRHVFHKDKEFRKMESSLEDVYFGSDDMHRTIGVVLMLEKFLSMINCKNIRYVDSEKVIKVKQGNKTKKRALYAFKLLQLLKGKKGTKKKIAMDLWSNRVHLCRGHVRTYGADAPLFGRIVGDFWIPPHARGSVKEGVIEKEYVLDPEDFR